MQRPRSPAATDQNTPADVRLLFLARHDSSSASASLYAALLAVFIGLVSLLLVLFEPQLGFVDSFHLTINLLMTLGLCNILCNILISYGV